MTSGLRGLEAGARRHLSEAFRVGQVARVDVQEYAVELELGRPIHLEPVAAVVRRAMTRGDEPEASDRWLAPRLHAALRLTRREAGDRRLWAYLSVERHPDYVRWRFKPRGGRPVPVDRFFGEDSKNAFARLWWAAELTRDGADYGPTVQALSSSEFARSWQPLDALHDRAVAVAVARFLPGVPTEESRRLAKALNLRLATLSLDAICASDRGDPAVIAAWCREEVDGATLLADDLPRGPGETRVDRESAERVADLLRGLARDIGLRRAEPGHRVEKT